MTLYDELIARGLIAQVTNEEEIKNMINNGKATFYIGFDCTADSLHVGHFMALCLMKRLQMAGNKPIALIGDGTTLIGDPSGRTDMRQMLTEETIKHNAECFKHQMERFIDFSDGKALMLYNSEWLKPLNYTWLSRLVPGVYRYVPVFKRLRREYAEGRDRVLRGATAVLFIHAPRESRFGAEDGNLAYENASLMAEALGVSQIYMGFVLTAVRQDRKAKLAAMLGLGDRRICAVMALGMPQFRYPNYIDRAPAPVTRK